jgi:hypothetical protein
MINHARTLFLNLSGRAGHRDEPGFEYTPPEYVPVVLPSYIQTARRMIFGAAPDHYFMAFRARELLANIHETELAQFVYALDSRVTYWPEPGRPFYAPEKQVRAAQVTGLATPLPHFSGDLFADNSRGRSVREFSLRVTTEDGPWAARLSAKDAPNLVTITPLTFAGDLSQRIALGGTGLSFQVQRPTTTTNWEIYTRVKPGAAVATLLPILDMLGEPLFLELFGVDDSVQPYATFKNLWNDHPNPIYRLNGLVLAMIYRTNDVIKLGSQRVG